MEHTTKTTKTTPTTRTTKARSRGGSQPKHTKQNGQHRHDECAKPMETVLHYVRMLNGHPSQASRVPDAAFDGSSDPSSPVAWRCSGCDTLVPRSQEPPDTCPCCGMARQDLEIGRE